MFEKLVAIEPVSLIEEAEKKLYEYAKEVVLFDDIPKDDEEIIKRIGDAEYCLSICTGSAVFAKAGLLDGDGKKATSNKRAFEWVKTMSNKTIWIEKARWVVSGKYYTSSGV